MVLRREPYGAAVESGGAGDGGGVKAVQVGVDRGLAVQSAVVSSVACYRGNGWQSGGGGGGGGGGLRGQGAVGQDVLAVQLGQRPDEALREALLLVRHVFGAQELGGGRRGGDHAVAGLDDQPLQLGRGQFEKSNVRGGQQVGRLVPQVRLDGAVGVRQVEGHALLQHLGVVSVAGGLGLRESGAQCIVVESRLHLTAHTK